MDSNFDHQMYLSKSKCWYSNNCLHFLKCAVPLKLIYLLWLKPVDRPMASLWYISFRLLVKPE